MKIYLLSVQPLNQRFERYLNALLLLLLLPCLPSIPVQHRRRIVRHGQNPTSCINGLDEKRELRKVRDGHVLQSGFGIVVGFGAGFGGSGCEGCMIWIVDAEEEEAAIVGEAGGG